MELREKIDALLDSIDANIIAKTYQKEAHKTSLKIPTHNLTPNQHYAMAGLSNEAGEVGGVLKKATRGDYGPDPATHPLFLKKLAGELGDTQWYLAECCTQFGLNLHEIMAQNLEKLKKRQEAGTIMGEGDDR